MIIKDEGSIFLGFSRPNNPHAFKEGVKVKWADHKVNSEHILIITDNTTLYVVLNEGTDRELMLFTEELVIPEIDIVKVAVFWSPEKFSLYVNGELKQKTLTIDL